MQDIEGALDGVTAFGGSVGIDLIYRRVAQSRTQWLRDLEVAISHDFIDHISCYSLVLKSDRHQPPMDVDVAMALDAIETLNSAGFRHYASCASGGLDFAKPGYECIYEVDHWIAPQASFMGLGPGAFGFLANSTTVNGLGLEEYFEATESGNLPIISLRAASASEMMRRFFVLGVKLHSVDLNLFRACHSVDPLSLFGTEISSLVTHGLATCDGDKLELSEVGRLFTDQIAEIFYSEDERLVVHPEEPEIRRAQLTGKRLARTTAL